MRKLTRNEKIAILSLPPLFGLVLTALYGLNIPVYDDWGAIIRFLNNVKNNGLSFSDLFAINNDSRYLFPKLVWLILGSLFHVNMKVYMYFEWFCLTASYFLVISYVRREHKQKISMYLLLGFLIFSVLQWDTDALLEATSVNWFLKQLFIVLGFLCFHYGYNCSKTKYLVYSGLSFIIASYSHLSGTFWLPVIMVIFFLLLVSKEKISKKSIFLMLLFCVIIYPLYFYHYNYMRIEADYHYAQIKDIIKYFFISLSSPLIPRQFLRPVLYTPIMILGFSLFVIAIVLVFYLMKHKKISDNIFPICLIFYGFIFCASITLGRVGFGIGQALSTRYVINILPTIIGIVLIVNKEIIGSNSCGITIKNISQFGVHVLFFLCAIINIDWSIPKNVYNHRKNSQSILLDYQNQPLEALQSFYPWWNDLETAKAAIKTAETNGWSLFYKNKSNTPP